MLRRLYTCLFYIALPFVLLRLWYRSLKNPDYLDRWKERFGFSLPVLSSPTIWIHAVSVGEVIAAIPLIKALKKKYSKIDIVVTTTTPTGAGRVRAAFSENVIHLYTPYDLPFIINRFIRKLKPSLLIIMETELWPNLLREAHQNRIPIFMANARLSERSMKGYQRIKTLMREMLSAMDSMAVQSEEEARRFVLLGMNPERIQVTGSLKFDLEIPSDLLLQAILFRKTLGEKRFVWIAASTHEGEEKIILEALRIIQKSVPNVLLVLVPRHLERFDKVAALCHAQGFSVVKRSEQKPCDENTSVFLGDSMGELLLFYAAADLAFVGGSLVEKGGQNPLEPVALGVPVMMGPSQFNFSAISKMLLAKEVMLGVVDAEMLVRQVTRLQKDPEKRKEMGVRGKNLIEQNKGSLAAHMNIIEHYFPVDPSHNL